MKITKNHDMKKLIALKFYNRQELHLNHSDFEIFKSSAIKNHEDNQQFSPGQKTRISEI
jgi:uncharacterized protein YjhX (UPF0386 family)